jgi:hypothetical protein
MGDSAAYPLNPDELTPEWLTGALRKDGCIERARVVSLTCEMIGEGVGFLGQIGRLTPTYDQVEDGAPRTLIGKFPTSVETARELAAMYGLYLCEINVYRRLMREIPLRTPHCYFNAISDDAKTFLLLLEDLGASGRMGDQVKGCSLDDARLAIREVAKLHAAWWDHPRLPDLHWLTLGSDLLRIAMTAAYPPAWKICLDQFGHLMSPAQRGAAPTLNERALRAIDGNAAAPLTILHADYRLDNMFFGTTAGDYEFAVIDWQVANRGWAAYDVAYFLASNVDSALRREQEMNLLLEYHAVLNEHRIRGGAYAWETCRTDYVRSIAIMFTGAFATVASLDTSNERGVALFETIMSRLATAADDLQALDTFPQ